MFKKTITIVILFLWRCVVGAQVITGVVCDEVTKLPVSDVYVYLDGTSVNTVTNNSGKFELVTRTVFTTKLVLHHLLYETAIIDHPFEELPDTLYIKEQVNTISEVVVYADRFSRKQKMQAFREQFLGMSRAGRSCTIMNEDDIYLYFNMQSHKLFASSDKPIVVVNNYLGYRISFILIDFWVQYFEANLDYRSIQNSFFAVVSSFSDIAPDNRRIKQRRDDVYEKSSNYFFKSFANDSLYANKFVLYNNRIPVNYQNYFAINDTLSQKQIRIISDTNINRRAYFGSKPSGLISVLYRNVVQSDIYFMTDTFRVDQYGNIDQIDKIFFTGQMGENRAGDMLPIDYEY